MEYFATSHKIFHAENEYIKNIPWHDMEYSFMFMKALAHMLMSLMYLHGAF